MNYIEARVAFDHPDPPLAGALASSRESIWGILSDRAKFATL